MKTFWKPATLVCAALMIAQGALAETPAPSEAELAAWAETYAAFGTMEPKWAAQGAEALKASSDAGVPIVYLDVRTPKEWENGFVPGAVKSTLTGLATPEGMGMLPSDKSTIIAVYCKSGHRSALAIPLLQRLGYTNAISMKKGYQGWVELGYPLEGVPQ